MIIPQPRTIKYARKIITSYSSNKNIDLGNTVRLA